MSTLNKILIITLAFLSFEANAQTDKATTERIVAQKNYVFVATTAIPTNTVEVSNVLRQMSGGNSGGAINLTGFNYDFKVKTDTLIAYLPYYGRSYVASMDQRDSGVNFTSTKFTYTTKKRKKGGWDVDINTKDVKDNVRMMLSIATSGYATLTVISNNKQSISYTGYLAEDKKKAK